MPGAAAERPEFLGVLLTDLVTITDAAQTVADERRAREHAAAIKTLFRALCRSLTIYQQQTLPQLAVLRAPSPRQALVDRQQLSRIGLIVEDYLADQQPPLRWPPPGQDPPAIVADLQEFYAGAVVAVRFEQQPTTEQVATAVEPVRRQACRLAKESWSSSDARRITEELLPPASDERAPLRLLHGAVVATATLTSLLQFPGAVTDFGPDVRRLVEGLTELLGDLVYAVAPELALGLGAVIRLLDMRHSL